MVEEVPSAGLSFDAIHSPQESAMPTVKEIRTSIDELLDRWEAAATALEHSANATAATVAEEVDAQKRKAAAAVEAVKESVATLADVPEQAKQEATAAADRVRAELDQARQQTLEAARGQRDKIEAAFREALDEHRKAAVAKGKELAESLGPMFNRAKSAFVKAYEEFTKDA
jgi:uncharacterized protein Yka (UPF0111/DUF47 family)